MGARLRLMRELLADLEAVGEPSVDDLVGDRLRLRALERVLTQLVDLAADTNQHLATSELDLPPATYRDSFDSAVGLVVFPRGLGEALKPSVGLRNVLVHQYVNVDLAIVAAAVPRAKNQYAAYVRHVAQWLARRRS